MSCLTWRRTIVLKGLRRALDAMFLFSLLLLRPILSGSSLQAPFVSLVLSYFGVFLLALSFHYRWSATMLRVIDLTLGAHCVYAIIAYLMRYDQHETEGFGLRTQGLMPNPLFFYPLAMMGLFCSIAFAGLGEKSERAFWKALSAICLLAIVLTFTRSAWIGTAAGLLALGVAMRQSQMRLLIVSAGIAALLLMTALVIRSGGKLVFLSPDGCTVHRLEVWQASWQAFMDRPLLGSGFNSYRERQAAFASPYFRSRGGTNTALCIYLHCAVEFGLLGLVIIGVGVRAYCQYFSHARRLLTTESFARQVLLGMHWFLVAMSVAWLTDAQFLTSVRPDLTFTLLMFLGLSLNVVMHATESLVPCPIREERILYVQTAPGLHAH